MRLIFLQIFLGKEMATPFFIPGMTAGHDEAPRINSLLANQAEQRGWAMGVGSQRRQLDSSNEECRFLA